MAGWSDCCRRIQRLQPGFAAFQRDSMNPKLRRQLILVIVGVSGAIVALIAATYLRQDACLDAGGRWVIATETCQLEGGGAMSQGSTVRAYLLGALVGLLAGTMLWRVYTLVASRGR